MFYQTVTLWMARSLSGGLSILDDLRSLTFRQEVESGTQGSIKTDVAGKRFSDLAVHQHPYLPNAGEVGRQGLHERVERDHLRMCSGTPARGEGRTPQIHDRIAVGEEVSAAQIGIDREWSRPGRIRRTLEKFADYRGDRSGIIFGKRKGS